MILGFAKRNRHVHHWTPNNKDVGTVKTCECGATKFWDSRKWAVKQPKKPKVAK